MRFSAAISASLLVGGLTAFTPAAQAQGAMPQHQGSTPMDTPTAVGGIGAVCTGVGEEAQNPRWLAYPVRIEFSNGGAQYLAGAHVQVTTAGGKPIAGVDCDGPWVLFRLEPGT